MFSFFLFLSNMGPILPTRGACRLPFKNYKYILGSTQVDQMKVIQPPFSINKENAGLFQGLFYCRSCAGYRPATYFQDAYVKSQRARCKTCRRKHEQSKTKSPEQRVLLSLRQKLRKLDRQLCKQWTLQDIVNLFSKYNPSRQPNRSTVVVCNPTLAFTPQNAMMVSRGEARRLAGRIACS